MDKLVSVIVPCYKVEKYLSRCLDSILHQSYKDMEIILVDDGSPDRSGEICEFYAKRDPRIVVIHQENKGLSGARNTGIDAAKGEYLFFIDSDDAIYPDCISTLCGIAFENDADLVSSEYFQGADPKAKEDNGNGHIETGNGAHVLDYVLQNSSWSAWGKLYRKSLIGDDRFLEGHLYEDYEFVPRQFLKAQKCAHVRSRLYFYFVNDEGIMGSSKACLDPYYIAFAEKNLDYVRNSSYTEDEKKRVEAGLYMHFMWDYTKPIRAHGAKQTKEFKAGCQGFLGKHHKDILQNKHLEGKYRRRFWFLWRMPGLFDSFYNLLYKLKHG